MSIPELLALAAIIKNETGVDKNTATRIGTLFTEIIKNLGGTDPGTGTTIPVYTISNRSELDAITDQGIYIIDGASHEVLIVLNEDASVPEDPAVVTEKMLNGETVYFSEKLNVVGAKMAARSFSSLSAIAVFDYITKTASNHDIANTIETIVMGADMYLYAINGNSIYKIDPADFTFTTITISDPLENVWAYTRALLLPSGNILFYDAVKYLVFNPVTHNIYSGSTGLSAGSLPAAVLAENGFVYIFPISQGKIIKINAVTTAPAFEFDYELIDFAVNNVYSAVVVGSYIYCSKSNETIICFNTADNTHTTFSGTGTQTITGLALAKNGKIYGISSENIYEIDVVAKTVTVIKTVTGESFYKIQMANDSLIYAFGLLNSRKNYIEISNIGTLTAADYTLPTDLSTLSSSNYNKYFNR